MTVSMMPSRAGRGRGLRVSPRHLALTGLPTVLALLAALAAVVGQPGNRPGEQEFVTDGPSPLLRTKIRAKAEEVHFVGTGRRLLLLGQDGPERLCLWDARSGAEVAILPMPPFVVRGEGTVYSSTVSPDGGTVAAAIYAPYGGLPRVMGVTPVGKGMAGTICEQWGDPQHYVYLWDVATARHTRTIAQGYHRVDNLVFAPDSRHVVTVENNFPNEIHLWDSGTGQRVRTIDIADLTPSLLTFTPDGSRLVVGNSMGLTVWDWQTGKQVRNFVVPSFDSESFGGALRPPDGKLLAAFGLSPRGKTDLLELWDVDKVQRVGRLLEGVHLKCVAFHPSGRWLAAGHISWGRVPGCVTLWDVERRKLVRRLGGQRSNDDVRSLAFSPNGRYLAASARFEDAQCVLVWDLFPREPQ